MEYHWPGATWRHSLEDFHEGAFDVELETAVARGMSRRQILEDVAAGRLEPIEAVRLLDLPAGSPRAVRLRSAYHAIEVVADPAVADLVVVDGTHHVQREGDVLVVSDTASEGSRFGTWQGGRRLVVRVNPELEVDVEVTGALLTVRGMNGALRAVVQAGSAGIEGVSGALDLRVTAGSAVIAGSPRDGDWRLSSESAAIERWCSTRTPTRRWR